MAHALREFIRTQMDQRVMDQATFTKRSGLTRSHVSKLLRDDREKLPQIPRRETLAGIAKAFNVNEQVVLATAVEALGLGYAAADFVYELSTASHEELTAELNRRLSGALQLSGEGTLYAGGSLQYKTAIEPLEDVDVLAAARDARPDFAFADTDGNVVVVELKKTFPTRQQAIEHARQLALVAARQVGTGAIGANLRELQSAGPEHDSQDPDDHPSGG